MFKHNESNLHLQNNLIKSNHTFMSYNEKYSIVAKSMNVIMKYFLYDTKLIINSDRRKMYIIYVAIK
ncbi:MAG: hypothetical protein RSD51_03455 [Malacoplasma sp.]